MNLFPILIFIDSFSVFRNLYRLLIGYYITPAGLTYKERTKSSNIFLLVLGPYSSNFANIIKGLGTLAKLNRGIT